MTLFGLRICRDWDQDADEFGAWWTLAISPNVMLFFSEWLARWDFGITRHRWRCREWGGGPWMNGESLLLCAGPVTVSVSRGAA